VSDWIFFDCFNTLIDDFDDNDSESGLGSLPDFAVELGAAQTRDEFLSAYRLACPVNAGDYAEVVLPARLTRALDSLDRLPPEEVGSVVKRLLDRWHAEYEPNLRLTPGAIEMLAHWYGSRRMGVVSNFYFPGYPQRYLERFGIDHYFEFVIDSASLGHRKPGSLILEVALRRAGCSPADVLFIGDRPDLDIEPAHRLGMSTLHLDRRSVRPRAQRTPAGFDSIRHWDDFRRDRS
jgi:HAD superfamily hydrolase (TIGR01509 family)